MTLPKWAIFTIWVYGENSHFCRIQLKFRFWLHKICWHITCKFQLQIRSNKKIIAKKRYEINSRYGHQLQTKIKSKTHEERQDMNRCRRRRSRSTFKAIYILLTKIQSNYRVCVEKEIMREVQHTQRTIIRTAQN